MFFLRTRQRKELGSRWQKNKGKQTKVRLRKKKKTTRKRREIPDVV